MMEEYQQPHVAGKEGILSATLPDGEENPAITPTITPAPAQHRGKESGTEMDGEMDEHKGEVDV